MQHPFILQAALVNPPTKDDVLFGRHAQSWNHEGNRRFRAIVSKYQAAYHSAKQRIKKVSIVAKIVSEVRSNGARFLRKDNRLSIWYEVDRKACIDKVGHAIRDKQSIAKRRVGGKQPQSLKSGAEAGRKAENLDETSCKESTSKPETENRHPSSSPPSLSLREPARPKKHAEPAAESKLPSENLDDTSKEEPTASVSVTEKKHHRASSNTSSTLEEPLRAKKKARSAAEAHFSSEKLYEACQKEPAAISMTTEKAHHHQFSNYPSWTLEELLRQKKDAVATPFAPESLSSSLTKDARLLLNMQKHDSPIDASLALVQSYKAEAEAAARKLAAAEEMYKSMQKQKALEEELVALRRHSSQLMTTMSEQPAAANPYLARGVDGLTTSLSLFSAPPYAAMSNAFFSSLHR